MSPEEYEQHNNLLRLAAESMDDAEKIRIANENRLRQLTRVGADEDGGHRGFGLTLENDQTGAVARVVGLVASMYCKSSVLKQMGWERPVKERGVMCCLEHAAEENLVKLMKAHPLGAWISDEERHGIGAKQAARLLAAIGDPYIRPKRVFELDDETEKVEPARPRSVSELWAYCGYSVVNPDGQPTSDTHAGTAVGVAPFRRKGVKSNWNPDARKRAWLVSKSIVKLGGPYREIYDAARVKHADAVHKTPCRQCGPSGHPAPVGSPLKDGHKHARALRVVSKTVLKDFWLEGKRIHEAAAA